MSDGLNDNESTTDKRLPFINYIPSHRNSERDNIRNLYGSTENDQHQKMINMVNSENDQHI